MGINKHIILASASPRRRELLEKAGIEFEVLITEANEEVDYPISPIDFVTLIAKRKLDAALEKIDMEKYPKDREIIIIAADTIVAIDGRILGKPKDFEEAFDMLNLLQGRVHEVFTGLAIASVKPAGTTIVQDYCCTQVFMNALTEDEIKMYIHAESPFDKAGSYAIQGKAAEFIEKIEGDYNNVVGLPLDLLLETIGLL
ncbi:MAG: Maf family protein [Eubacteriales bacterium]